MTINDERKVEASIPVSARVNIMALAEMLLYFESQGMHVKSMSQLVGWSVDTGAQLLEYAKMLPHKVVTMLEANEIIQSRGLYQPSVMKRGRLKLNAGRRMENLRAEGEDPKFVPGLVERDHNILHNEHSVKAAPDISIADMTKKYHEIEEQKKLEVEAERKAAGDRVTAAMENIEEVEPSTGALEELKAEVSQEEQRIITQLQIKDEIKNGTSSIIRKKTNEELDADDVKREEKDREYLKQQNFIPKSGTV